MTPVSRSFIKASLIYLVLGGLLGLFIALFSETAQQVRPVHAHVMLIGWVSMLMFGVAYHILPRFHGRPLYSDPLALLHYWAANIALIGMSASIMIGVSIGTGVFGALQTVGFFLFIYNIWRSIEPFTPPGQQSGSPPNNST